jgi:hypothetical protein
MALSRTPGPEGLRDSAEAIDPEAPARTLSPLPGPIGLWIKPKILMAPKAASSHQFGITVHQKSQISAQAWVKKINDSDDVPDYFKEQIKSRGNVIHLTNPKKFKVPTNVIPKDWLPDWLPAFSVEEWEMTTGCLEISVKKDDSAGPLITVVHNPDLSSGETIDGFTQYTMTVSSRGSKSVAIERGNTLPTGVTLKTGRKLIAVANRIALSLGEKITMFKFEDFELLEVWFHEIACHAGRNTNGMPDLHGDKDVESCASDIEGMFPKATTVSKVFVGIQGFLKAQ